MTRFTILILTLLAATVILSVAFLYWNFSSGDVTILFSCIFPLLGILVLYFGFQFKKLSRQERFMGITMIALTLVTILFFYFLLGVLSADTSLNYDIGQG